MWKAVVVLVVVLLLATGCAAAAAASDRDGDGLPDRWEQRYGLSTAKKSAKGDPDRDGLRNRAEYRRHLNPLRADTDRDGFADGVEVRAGTNPRDRRSHPRRRSRARRFPTASSTGVRAGWRPARTRTSTLAVTRPGAVVQNVLFAQGADLVVHAPNVTVRNVKFEGGQIDNQPGSEPCANGLVVEDTTFELRPGQVYDATGTPAIQWGGYTARRVKVWGRSEGLFVSGKQYGCGPVRIEDSLIRLDDHGDCRLHADGMQGYGGNRVIVRNVVADSSRATCGTAPFFYPHSQGNTSADVDRLLVIGGGYSFRLGMPARVRGLKIVDRGWAYGPIDVRCSAVSAWDAAIVRIGTHYRVTRTVRSQPCDTDGGG